MSALPEISKDGLKRHIALVIRGLTELRHDGRFHEPNLDGTAGDYVSFNSWEWPQGVGLYGIARLWQHTHDEEAKKLLENWYETQLSSELPPLNVNTTAPMLALSILWSETGDPRWEEALASWAERLMAEMPRTRCGGFQHNVSDKINDDELWDDTLFMVALFLANYGRAADRPELSEEACLQFLVHTHYLSERETGLWFHGWTFDGHHNFARARWARGNSWISAGLLDFLETADLTPSLERYFGWVLRAQMETLLDYQCPNGAWRTLVDDEISYEEISATAAFGYAFLKGARLGYGDERWERAGRLALQAVIDNIEEDGTVANVSYGTRMGNTLQFYRDIPIHPTAYGQSMSLLCLVEALQH
ncbi:glycoside hydrolase family 105 protein [Salinicola corii]|uniref:Glycoside hydrolase family 105 protein n=1 Tax=Salinicola corii TaxID=2606937 RepID=A0A640W8I5_9GAMM|nr:glycoside hydrolase family 88 protein [Salinicola corii]KAA0016016.1 glycoside hydrolase family 105 protein [Salinicola corii]